MAEPERGSTSVVVAVAAAVALWFLVLVSGVVVDGVDHALIEGVLGQAVRVGSVADDGTRACRAELSRRLPALGVGAFGCRRLDDRLVAFAEWEGRVLTVAR